MTIECKVTTTEKIQEQYGEKDLSKKIKIGEIEEKVVEFFANLRTA